MFVMEKRSQLLFALVVTDVEISLCVTQILLNDIVR